MKAYYLISVSREKGNGERVREEIVGGWLEDKPAIVGCKQKMYGNKNEGDSQR